MQKKTLTHSFLCEITSCYMKLQKQYKITKGNKKPQLENSTFVPVVLCDFVVFFCEFQVSLLSCLR